MYNNPFFDLVFSKITVLAAPPCISSHLESEIPAGHAGPVHFRPPRPRRGARRSRPPPLLSFANTALIFPFNFLQLHKTMESTSKTCVSV